MNHPKTCKQCLNPGDLTSCDELSKCSRFHHLRPKIHGPEFRGRGIPLAEKCMDMRLEIDEPRSSRYRENRV